MKNTSAWPSNPDSSKGDFAPNLFDFTLLLVYINQWFVKIFFLTQLFNYE